jgi:hypothetical protein
MAIEPSPTHGHDFEDHSRGSADLAGDAAFRAMAGSFPDYRPGAAPADGKLLCGHRSHCPFGIKDFD